MARGGARLGAGRKKGQATKINAQARKKAIEGGITPLEYMLKVMRNPRADTERRDGMAKAAAPFVHAKLASMEHRGAVGSYDLSKVDENDLDRLEAILRAASVTGGGPGGEGEEGGGE